MSAVENPFRQPETLERVLFGSHPRLRDLERQLYGHVLDAIDFGKLSNLETYLFALISDLEVDEELALDLSKAMVGRAIERVVEDPSRYCNFGPPPGITEEEARAVEFDETCPFCVVEANERAEAAKREAEGAEDPAEEDEEEDCPCCNDLAQMWRKQHADVLARHGLAQEPQRHPGGRSS